MGNWFTNNVPAELYDPRLAVKGVFGKNAYDPNATTLDQTQANKDLGFGMGARLSQSSQLGRLNQQMDGRGPTVAGQQQRFGIAEAMRNAGTQAANARGVNRGMALRESLYAGQDAQAQANRDAALMRAQEQLSAQQQFGALATSQRQGDQAQRQASLDAAKADQSAKTAEMQLETGVAEGNAGREQKGWGAVAASVGGAIKGFSDIRAKESIEPISSQSFAQRLGQQLRVDDAELQRRADAESNARIEAALASSNAGYGEMSAQSQRDASGVERPNNTTLIDKPGGTAGAIGGGLETMGQGLMSDQKSKERIRELEGMLYGRSERKLDPQNPYFKDYMSDAERRVENGFDSKANLAPIHPYSFRYKPEFAALIAEQAAGMAPPSQQADAAGAAYADARIPRAGVMAQEVSKAPGARGVVSKTPVGLMLDTKRSLGFTMANQAGLDKRLSRLEELLGNSTDDDGAMHMPEMGVMDDPMKKFNAVTEESRRRHEGVLESINRQINEPTQVYFPGPSDRGSVTGALIASIMRNNKPTQVLAPSGGSRK